jgi:hypothetical protein
MGHNCTDPWKVWLFLSKQHLHRKNRQYFVKYEEKTKWYRHLVLLPSFLKCVEHSNCNIFSYVSPPDTAVHKRGDVTTMWEYTNWCTGRTTGDRFPAGAGNFSLRHPVQKSSGAHPSSYPMGTRGFLPWGKASGAWSWPIASIYCRG